MCVHCRRLDFIFFSYMIDKLSCLILSSTHTHVCSCTVNLSQTVLEWILKHSLDAIYNHQTHASLPWHGVGKNTTSFSACLATMSYKCCVYWHKFGGGVCLSNNHLIAIAYLGFQKSICSWTCTWQSCQFLGLGTVFAIALFVPRCVVNVICQSTHHVDAIFLHQAKQRAERIVAACNNVCSKVFARVRGMVRYLILLTRFLLHSHLVSAWELSRRRCQRWRCLLPKRRNSHTRTT